MYFYSAKAHGFLCGVLLFSSLAFSQSSIVPDENNMRCGTQVGNNIRFALNAGQQGGIYLTSTGTLRILLVFVSYSDDNNYHPYWPAHQPPTGIGTYIDPNSTTGSTNFANLTNYFNQMSLGLYHVIGEAIYVETPHTKVWYDSQHYGRYETNKDVLQNAVDSRIDFALYDNWHYVSDYFHQNNPDGIVDMIVMIWRGFQFGILGEASLGYGADITLDGKTIKFYYGGNSGSGVTVCFPYTYWPERTLQNSAHEIAHWLLGGYHPYTPGGAPEHAMWAVLGPQGACGVCMNAYERERLGWINCIEPADGLNAPLADYITSGVAYKYHPTNGDPNEYFYCENHQKLSIYDDAVTNAADKGIQVLQQEGLYGNWPNLRTLPQDGRWNWINPHYNTTCFPGYSVPVFQKSSVQRDQSGFSYSDGIPTSQGNRDWMLSFIDNRGIEQCGGFNRGAAPFQGGFNPSINTVLSPWSNPNTNTWYNSATSFAFEVVSQNGNTVTLHFYLSSPLTSSPSKPQNVRITNTHPSNVSVAWDANLESDISLYEVWRNDLTFQTGWALIASTTSTSYTDPDYTWASIYGNNQLQYKVRAKDNTNKYSSFSDVAYTTGEPNSRIRRSEQSKLSLLALELPTSFSVASYPNPFNPSTTISYQLAENAKVALRIYDVAGRLITSLKEGEASAGYHSVIWNGTDATGVSVAGGVYFCRFIAAPLSGAKAFVRADKLLLLK